MHYFTIRQRKERCFVKIVGPKRWRLARIYRVSQFSLVFVHFTEKETTNEYLSNIQFHRSLANLLLVNFSLQISRCEDGRWRQTIDVKTTFKKDDIDARASSIPLVLFLALC